MKPAAGRGLGALGAMVGLMALLLAAIALLVRADAAGWLVPPPEQVAEHFFKSLKAHNFGAARATLSGEAQASVSADDLREWQYDLEQVGRDVREAHGEDSQQQGDTAVATVQVELSSGEQVSVELPLEQVNGLWEITTLAPAQEQLGP
jgi:hypothetical protein